MSVRNLVLFLLCGGFLYGCYYLYSGHIAQPLRADLVAIDTAQITRIRIHPMAGPDQLIQLQRLGTSWIASNEQVHIRANEAPVKAILQNLLKITTIEVAATQESEWPTYGLAASQAVRVEVFADNQLMEDFWVSNNSSSPAGADSITYIRNHGEQEIYTVKGLAVEPFQKYFKVFRSTAVLSIPENEKVDSFVYLLADSNYVFRAMESSWSLNHRQALNETHIQQYLQSLKHINSGRFINDFDRHQATVSKYGSLQFHLHGNEKPILIEAYLDSLRTPPFVVYSTHNPSAFFASDSAGIFSRLFREVDWFLQQE